jgi:hypothetical protein
MFRLAAEQPVKVKLNEAELLNARAQFVLVDSIKDQCSENVVESIVFALS